MRPDLSAAAPAPRPLLPAGHGSLLLLRSQPPAREAAHVPWLPGPGPWPRSPWGGGGGTGGDRADPGRNMSPSSPWVAASQPLPAPFERHLVLFYQLSLRGQCLIRELMVLALTCFNSPSLNKSCFSSSSHYGAGLMRAPSGSQREPCAPLTCRAPSLLPSWGSDAPEAGSGVKDGQAPRVPHVGLWSPLSTGLPTPPCPRATGV